MIGVGVNGIILRVKNNAIGDMCSELPIYGKTSEEWVADAFAAPCKIVSAPAIINIIDRVKNAVDRTKQLTVVLYGDTPLVTAQTVHSAITQLMSQNANAVRLPRGEVYKTEYLLSLSSLYAREPAATGEFAAITDCESLSHITDAIRKNILNYHTGKGAVIYDYNNTHIDCTVTVEKGAIIEPYNFIKGKTTIKAGAHIMPGNRINNCVIDEGATVDSSRLYNSYVGKNTTVGPFAYVRPDVVIGNDCRIGDFVELKSCIIGDGCKISHLSYVGDAELGAQCNVGCGVVFANYDGKNKYRSVIGSRVFIGSNANIVAPVKVESGAFIAAGSTITDGVPERALAIARARQVNYPDWAGNMYAPLDMPLPKTAAAPAGQPMREPIIEAKPTVVAQPGVSPSTVVGQAPTAVSEQPAQAFTDIPTGGEQPE